LNAAITQIPSSAQRGSGRSVPGAMTGSSPGWLPAAKKLAEQLVHHLDEEEEEIFQIAGKAFSEDQKQSLAKEFQQRRHQLAAAE
jgi:hypothetical protein